MHPEDRALLEKPARPETRYSHHERFRRGGDSYQKVRRRGIVPGTLRPLRWIRILVDGSLHPEAPHEEVRCR